MTLCLTRLTLREIRLPLVEPFRTAGGVVDMKRILLAELTDADGHAAWSECVAESRPSYSPDTVDTCWMALTDWIAPLVLGASFACAADVDAKLDDAVRGHQMARATVEMGIFALSAERQRLSLATLLAREVGAEARALVGTGISLGFQSSPETLAERVRLARRQGYQRVKVKVQPGRDVDWVRAAHAAAGPDGALTVDANCSYSMEEPAHMEALHQLDAMHLAMIEQPLAHDDLVRHAELQRQMTTPLCLDESIRDAATTEAMIALGSARMVNLKPGRVGGFRQALMIHDLCRKASVRLWCGGMLESGIGRAYNVALASLPGFTEPGDLSPSARYWSRDVVTSPWTMDDRGNVQVPIKQSGIGVNVDVDFIDQLTVRATTLTAR